MDNIGKPEIVTQKRVIDFFVNKLRYNYIGNLKDQENHNIDEEKLVKWLTGSRLYRSLRPCGQNDCQSATICKKAYIPPIREVYPAS